MTVSNSLESGQDLRVPVFTKLRKGISVGWRRVFILVLIDCLLLSAAWLLANTYGTTLGYDWNAKDNLLFLAPILTIQIGLIATKDLYKSGEHRRNYFGLIQTISFSQFLLLIIAFLYQPNQLISRSTFVLSWGLSVVFLVMGRFSVNLVLEYLRSKGAVRDPIFLLCSVEDKEKAIKLLEQEKCYSLQGWSNISSLNEDGVCEAIIEKIRDLGVREVFVCSWSLLEKRMFLYWSLRNAGITLRILPTELEPFGRNSEISMIGGIPSMKLLPPLVTGSDFWIKRCFDFCCASLLLLALLPLLLFIALLIKLDSPGPIFYKQVRIGLHGREFKVWKFRTMVVNADKLQKELEAYNEMKDGVLFKMKSDPRITRIGKFLRRYSLDELPQLFNIFLGQMSLIGPRPFPMRDIQKMSDDHLIRHQVLPGITGLWQVSGRSDITNFEDVVHLDILYIENWSLQLDWQILLRTIAVVFGRTGAY